MTQHQGVTAGTSDFITIDGFDVQSFGHRVNRISDSSATFPLDSVAYCGVIPDGPRNREHSRGYVWVHQEDGLQRLNTTGREVLRIVDEMKKAGREMVVLDRAEPWYSGERVDNGEVYVNPSQVLGVTKASVPMRTPQTDRESRLDNLLNPLTAVVFRKQMLDENTVLAHVGDQIIVKGRPGSVQKKVKSSKTPFPV